MSDTAADAHRYADRARAAARILATAPTRQKNEALSSIATAIRRRRDTILESNEADLDAGRASGLAEPFLDRLALTAQRVEGIAAAVEAVRDLPDPVGEIVDIWTRPNGLQVRQQRIPLGVVLAVYESRPNVTVDAAALCLKSGNASILRGGREALGSNMALWSAVAEGLTAAGLPAQAVQLVDRPDRELLLELLQLEGRIDLAIPRGGEGLIRFVAEHARVPVIKHYKGVCHLFLDESAPEDQSIAIALDGKSRPSACNSLETILVHANAAERLLPPVCTALQRVGIELRAEPRAHGILRGKGIDARLAQPDDFGQEFLAKVLSIKVVEDLDAALDHIATHGSLHTEAIVTTSLLSARRFGREVEASCVLINASTRFNDGGELGLGAEIGISTSKLHAFGPMGLRELTAKKFVVLGEGQVRG